jgi:hypothetical protein
LVDQVSNAEFPMPLYHPLLSLISGPKNQSKRIFGD